MHIDQEASVPVAPRLRQLSGQRMSPQQAAQHTGSAKQHKEHQINGNGAQQGQRQEQTTLPSRDRESMQFQLLVCRQRSHHPSNAGYVGHSFALWCFLA